MVSTIFSHYTTLAKETEFTDQLMLTSKQYFTEAKCDLHEKLTHTVYDIFQFIIFQSMRVEETSSNRISVICGC